MRPTRYANQCGDLSEIHEEEPNGILSTTNAGNGSQDFEYTHVSEQASETQMKTPRNQNNSASEGNGSDISHSNS